MTLHWDYHRQREADVLRALRMHPVAEIHPKERRLPLVRLMRRRRASAWSRTFRIA
jgi:hypothetical protein